MSLDAKARKALEEPFPRDKVQMKSGGGRRPDLPYISHGLVTERLTAVDPDWTSRQIATHTYENRYTDQQGNPRVELHCAGVEIELCLKGVCRHEAGGPQRIEQFALEIKNAYSDALKRAAMRFGVALHMWEDLLDAVGDDDYGNSPQNAQKRPSEPRKAANPKSSTPAPTKSAAPAKSNAQPAKTTAPENGKITEAQNTEIWTLARKCQLEPAVIQQRSMKKYGREVAALMAHEAAAVIAFLTADFEQRQRQGSNVEQAQRQHAARQQEAAPVDDERHAEAKKKKLARFWIIAKEKNIPETVIRDYFREVFDVESSKDLNYPQLCKAVSMIEAEKPRPAPVADPAGA